MGPSSKLVVQSGALTVNFHRASATRPGIISARRVGELLAGTDPFHWRSFDLGAPRRGTPRTLGRGEDGRGSRAATEDNLHRKILGRRGAAPRKNKKARPVYPYLHVDWLGPPRRDATRRSNVIQILAVDPKLQFQTVASGN